MPVTAEALDAADDPVLAALAYASTVDYSASDNF